MPARPARFLKTGYTVALLVAAVVALAGLSGFAWAEKNVTLLVDGQSQSVTTKTADVASLLAEAGVAVNRGDLVSPDPSATLADGDVILVRHAVPVTLKIDGRAIELRVLGRTVADALVMDGLDPTGGLTVSPAVDTPLQSGMTITAADVFLRVSEEQITLAPVTVVRGDPKLPSNVKVVVRKARAGSAIRVWQTLVTGGVEGRRSIKAVRVLVPAVAGLVRVGTTRRFVQVIGARPRVAARAPRPAPAPPIQGRDLKLEATAYTPYECGQDGAWVAQQRRRYNIPEGWGIIAVDPAVIHLGSRVFVEGYGYAVAADTGGAIQGDIIDVCYWGDDLSAPAVQASASQRSGAAAAANRWGRRYGVRVTVLN
jgi:3D (Asp-Asp-Asp) domain-containing protein